MKNILLEKFFIFLSFFEKITFSIKNCHLSNTFWLYQLRVRTSPIKCYSHLKSEIFKWNTLYFHTHLFLQCCQLNCLFFLFSGASMLSHILSSLFRKGTGSPRPSELPTMSPWHAPRKRGCGRPPFWLRHHWSHGNCQWVVHGRRDWFWRHFLYWLQEPWVCFSPGSMLNLRQFLVLKLCHGSQGNFFFREPSK